MANESRIHESLCVRRSAHWCWLGRGATVDRLRVCINRIVPTLTQYHGLALLRAAVVGTLFDPYDMLSTLRVDHDCLPFVSAGSECCDARIRCSDTPFCCGALQQPNGADRAGADLGSSLGSGSGSGSGSVPSCHVWEAVNASSIVAMAWL